MSRRLFVSLLVVLAFVPAGVVSPAGGIPGIYELSFHRSNGDPLLDDTLPVGRELVLKAHVMDVFGTDAQTGSVNFQVCSRAGIPLPSIDCDVNGTASWTNVITMKVTGEACPGGLPGYACVNFGFCRTPRSVGFRFRYTGQGSGIASGLSASKNATWILP